MAYERLPQDWKYLKNVKLIFMSFKLYYKPIDAFVFILYTKVLSHLALKILS